MSVILLKVGALNVNDLYYTNKRSDNSIDKHFLPIDIEERLNASDGYLVFYQLSVISYIFLYTIVITICFV